MTADLDEQVEQVRHRPLDEAGPFTFVAADVLTMMVLEGGRVINAVVLVATGVNADGRREVLGLRVATRETGLAVDDAETQRRRRPRPAERGSHVVGRRQRAQP